MIIKPLLTTAKLWVLGGHGSNLTNDIWMSTNGGTNWSQVAVDGEHWFRRDGHQAFAYDRKLWVLGGRVFDGTSFPNANDIWWSSDGGTNWTEVSVNGLHWSARQLHQAFAYDSKLWVLGGTMVVEKMIFGGVQMAERTGLK